MSHYTLFNPFLENNKENIFRHFLRQQKKHQAKTQLSFIRKSSNPQRLATYSHPSHNVYGKNVLNVCVWWIKYTLLALLHILLINGKPRSGIYMGRHENGTEVLLCYTTAFCMRIIVVCCVYESLKNSAKTLFIFFLLCQLHK